MIKFSNVKVIDMGDWDNLVEQTYGRPYCFQQQYGCQERGMFDITIPSQYTEDEEMHDSIPEVVNGSKIGVKFNVWLQRDPNQPIPNESYNGQTKLFWHRSFYPDVHTVANDLYEKGLIEAGDYKINIDW